MATGTGGAKGDDDALVRHCTVTLPGASDGPLAGLTFAIKDLFDVKGALPPPPPQLTRATPNPGSLRPTTPRSRERVCVCGCVESCFTRTMPCG